MMDSKNRILIVDDEADLLEMYSELIEDEGFNVKTCESGEKALEVLSEENYNLIISDNNMFEVSGLDLLSYVNLNMPDTPFFLVTGSKVANLKFVNPLSTFISKPLDVFQLIDMIKDSVPA